MKSLLINLIVIFFFCNSLFAAEIELLRLKLYDKISDVDKFHEKTFYPIGDGEKCKKNHCNYKFKNKRKIQKEGPSYNMYELATNKDNKIISISYYTVDADSIIASPYNFAEWIKVFGKPMCETQMSWSIDYLTQKYKVSRKDFITTYSEGKSINPNVYPDILFLQSKLYLDSDKKIFESYCRYSRSDSGEVIIAVNGTKLMTKDYHDAFEKNFPKKKIDKFDANDIVSYLFPSSY